MTSYLVPGFCGVFWFVFPVNYNHLMTNHSFTVTPYRVKTHVTENVSSDLVVPGRCLVAWPLTVGKALKWLSSPQNRCGGDSCSTWYGSPPTPPPHSHTHSLTHHTHACTHSHITHTRTHSHTTHTHINAPTHSHTTHMHSLTHTPHIHPHPPTHLLLGSQSLSVPLSKQLGIMRTSLTNSAVAANGPEQCTRAEEAETVAPPPPHPKVFLCRSSAG